MVPLDRETILLAGAVLDDVVLLSRDDRQTQAARALGITSVEP